MLIRFLNGVEKHYEKNIALGFIESGAAVQLPNRKETCLEAQARCPLASKPTTPCTRWSVRPAQTISELRYPPQIYAKCTLEHGGCGSDFFAMNPRKSITTPFVHGASCNFVREYVPDEVAKEYEAARNAFYPVQTFVEVAKDGLAALRESLRMGAGR